MRIQQVKFGQPIPLGNRKVEGYAKAMEGRIEITLLSDLGLVEIKDIPEKFTVLVPLTNVAYLKLDELKE